MEVNMAEKAGKVSVIGTGIIGSTVAYTLLLKALAAEIMLVNRNEGRARAKEVDLSHCTPILEDTVIKHGSLKDSYDSDIVVVTCGMLPSERGTRMDVLPSNIEIFKSIIPEIAQYSPEAVIIVVTNPVDVMTYAAYRLSGFPRGRVIGSGTLLDTTRLKYIIGRKFGLASSGIEAVIVGEHGDSMVPVWSLARYMDEDLGKYLKDRNLDFDCSTKSDLLQQTRRAGWEIRLGNEHSCYGISLSVVRIIEGLLGYHGAPLPVSSLLRGEHGISEVCLSLPVKLGRKGIEEPLPIALSGEELVQLKNSASVLSGYVEQAESLIKKRTI